MAAECSGEQKAPYRSERNGVSPFVPFPLPRAAILVWDITPELLTSAFLGHTLSFPVVYRHGRVSLWLPSIKDFPKITGHKHLSSST